MISSRKESNVKKAVNELLQEGLSVAGTVCHVGKAEQRKKLFDEVCCKKCINTILYRFLYRLLRTTNKNVLDKIYIRRSGYFGF